jgi:hypothetical protein
MAIPINITVLFFIPPATSGTNGGEQISAVELIMVVSVSILKILARISCISKLMKMTKPIFKNSHKECKLKFEKSAMVATVKLKIRIKNMPKGSDVFRL